MIVMLKKKKNVISNKANLKFYLLTSYFNHCPVVSGNINKTVLVSLYIGFFLFSKIMKLKLNFHKCCVYIINMPEQIGDCVAIHRGVTLDHLSNWKKKDFSKIQKISDFNF